MDIYCIFGFLRFECLRTVKLIRTPYFKEYVLHEIFDSSISPLCLASLIKPSETSLCHAYIALPVSFYFAARPRAVSSILR